MYIDERKNGEFKLKHFNADNRFISGIYNISKSSFIKPPRTKICLRTNSETDLGQYYTIQNF
jgi:hypothetical protein